MAEHVKKVRVFVASPGDVLEERAQVGTAVDELNRTVCLDRGVLMELVRWETHTHPEIGRPQEIINSQIGAYDIFVGIMWKRLGSPTGKARSGTEEELWNAVKAREEGQSVHILFYFCQEAFPALTTKEEVEQLEQVLQFRKELSHRGLAWEYDDRSHFVDVIRPHLAQVVIYHYSEVHKSYREDVPYIPLADKLHALLELSKERSASRNLPYTTANLLLVLFEAESGFAFYCFERVRVGLARQIRASLRSYVEDTLPTLSIDRHFTPFEWVMREEIREAQRLALQEKCRVVTEKHLLLSILETSASNTVRQFREYLGQELHTVLEVVRDTPLNIPTERTPGKVFL